MLGNTQGYLRSILFTKIFNSNNETFISFYSSQDIHRCNGTDDFQKQCLGPSTLQITKLLFNQDLGMEMSCTFYTRIFYSFLIFFPINELILKYILSLLFEIIAVLNVIIWVSAGGWCTLCNSSRAVRPHNYQPEYGHLISSLCLAIFAPAQFSVFWTKFCERSVFVH